MSVRINQNISAMSAHRNMAANDANMSKSIEKLSSGLRINSAADDAAGLVVSENLRTQVSGMEQASRNSQDGINMIKTAEASLNEVEVQLRNIRDLTLHAANATTNATMRAADQAQVDQALKSIDRIATTTKFAGRSLLDASSNLAQTSYQVGANAGDVAQLDAIDTNASNMTTTGLGFTGTGTAKYAVATAGTAYSTVADGTNEQFSVKIDHADGTSESYVFTMAAKTSGGDVAASANADTYAAAINTKMGTLSRPGGDLADIMTATNVGGKITFTQSGPSGDQASSAKLTVASTSNDGKGALYGSLGTTANGKELTGAVTLTADATSNLAAIDKALDKVNTLRVNLGAFQKNTLESNLNSLAVAKENTSASESAIRDTDMAEEMVNFTKNQILTQAAQAMLTQANQAPQNILQMLRG